MSVLLLILFVCIFAIAIFIIHTVVFYQAHVSETSDITSVCLLDPANLSVITYNIQTRPYIDDLSYRAIGLHTRKSDAIANRLPVILDTVGADVVVLTEAFSHVMLDAIRDNLNAYPHSTTVLDFCKFRKSRRITNGGVVIFSKYPIVESKEHCFANSAYVDSLSAKGIQYVKINKSGMNYNIIATHLNASYGKRNGADIRRAQIAEIADFIQTLNLPTTEPVIFAGDMNIDPHINPDEYANMISTLDMQQPQNAGHTYSLVNKPMCVDYIMYAKKHRQPIQATCDIRQITYNGRNISDHYPVIGIFRF